MALHGDTFSGQNSIRMPGAPSQRFMLFLVTATEKWTIFCTQAAGPGLLPQPLSGPQWSPQALLAALWGCLLFFGPVFSIFTCQSASKKNSVKVTDECHPGLKLCCPPASASRTSHHLPSFPCLKMPFRTLSCLHHFHFLLALASTHRLITHRLSTSSCASSDLCPPSSPVSPTVLPVEGFLTVSFASKKEEQSRALAS